MELVDPTDFRDFLGLDVELLGDAALTARALELAEDLLETGLFGDVPKARIAAALDALPAKRLEELVGDRAWRIPENFDYEDTVSDIAETVSNVTTPRRLPDISDREWPNNNDPEQINQYEVWVRSEEIAATLRGLPEFRNHDVLEIAEGLRDYSDWEEPAERILNLAAFVENQAALKVRGNTPTFDLVKAPNAKLWGFHDLRPQRFRRAGRYSRRVGPH